MTGKEIDTEAQPTPLGDLPISMIRSPDNHFAIVCGMGYQQSLYSVDLRTTKLVNKIDFISKRRTPTSEPGGEDAAFDQPTDSGQTNGIYFGLAADTAGNIYAAQGAHDSIAILSISPAGQLALTGTFNTKPGDFPAGLATDRHDHLFVSNNAAVSKANEFKHPGSMAIYDLVSQKELGRYAFSSPADTTNFPLAIAATRDGNRAYVASERDGTVYTLNTTDKTKPTLTKLIAVGANPDALLLSGDESRLYVANSDSDTISVIDCNTLEIADTILLRPGTVRGLAGASPTSLTFSPDEKTLYATFSNMNAIGVIDLQTSSLSGMIPTGWFPSAILATADNRLLFTNAKGSSPRNPSLGYDAFVKKPDRTHYVLNALPGNLQTVSVASNDSLRLLTDRVMLQNHIRQMGEPPNNPLADIGLKAGKIKHVIYIIKENRTYDQVLGDDARGNGDAGLAIFGKAITPNQHALADRFVLLDNTYACGEVSGDGWVWSTQGIANAYVARNIPYNYSRRGREFDFEGANNGYPTGGFPATDADGKPTSLDPDLKSGAPSVPDVAGERHLWDMAKSAGLSYRNYGFFLMAGNEKKDPKKVPINYPTVAGLQPPGHDLQGLSDADFLRFDLDFPDSDAPQFYFKQTGDEDCLYARKTFGKYNCSSRFEEWNREFKLMLEKDSTGGSVPALMLVRLPHDHTQALGNRKHTPAAEVADNDYAVGQLIEAVSHSPIWESTAVFVIEDDAQAGPDHVDCHRTTCFVISPWIKRGSIDHAFHNTDSVLKTMELLLSLPPMSQFDALAAPIMNWDDHSSNNEPFAAILPAKEVIAEMNPRTTTQPTTVQSVALAKMIADSDAMDFQTADSAPADVVNKIIWKSVRGIDSEMPTPRNTLLSPIGGDKPQKDDDD